METVSAADAEVEGLGTVPAFVGKAVGDKVPACATSGGAAGEDVAPAAARCQIAEFAHTSRRQSAERRPSMPNALATTPWPSTCPLAGDHDWWRSTMVRLVPTCSTCVMSPPKESRHVPEKEHLDRDS